MENPLKDILDEVKEVKSLLLTLKNQPDKELLNRFYTIQEAAKILNVSPQSVKNYIEKGTLKAEKFGRPYRIKHYDLFNSNNKVKSLKYKR